MYLGDLIKEYRSKHKLSQREFGKKCDLSHNYIAALEKVFDTRSGKPIAPTLDAVKNISIGMNVSLQDLLNILDDDQEFNIKDTLDNTDLYKKHVGIKIPVLGSVAAGIPIEAIEDIVDYEEIDEEMAKKGDFFGLIVKGNSMFPYIIENDILIVRKQSDVESGEIAIINVNGSEATVKKVIKHDDGSIILQPFNPMYSPTTYSKEDIEGLPIRIVGRFTELRRKGINC